MREPLGRLCVAARLHQYVQHVAVLVDRAPQVVLLAVDLHEHFIEVPAVAGAGPAAAQPAGVVGSEPFAPGPDRLVGDYDAAFEQQVLHVTQA